MSNFPLVSLLEAQSLSKVKVSPMGELAIAEVSRLVGTAFVGTTLDTNFWTAAVANSGTAAIANAQLTLATNGSTSGSATVQSVRTGRYVTSCANKFRGIIRTDTAATASNIRRWGAFTPIGSSLGNGAYFELNGTTFNLVTLKTDNPTAVASGSFNGPNGATYTVDTNVHTYEITYTNSKVRFYIDDVLIHTVTASLTTWTDTLTLPVRLENTNSGISTAIVVEARATSISRMGMINTTPHYTRISGSNVTAAIYKYGAGRLCRIVLGRVWGSGGLLTIYDALSAANTIASVTLTNTNISNVDFDLDFYTGLTITTAGTISNGDLTVVYE